MKHQKKANYACERCDFIASSEEHFKKHLELAHDFNVRRFTKVSHAKKSNKLCINWNRGHCTFDKKCKFEHKEMPPCMFMERCNRMDCVYWHKASTGKFPFLECPQTSRNLHKLRRTLSFLVILWWLNIYFSQVYPSLPKFCQFTWVNMSLLEFTSFYFCYPLFSSVYPGFPLIIYVNQSLC